MAQALFFGTCGASGLRLVLEQRRRCFVAGPVGGSQGRSCFGVCFTRTLLHLIRGIQPSEAA
jgi:hypothetical protein